jgi:hypothetical protein
MPGRLLTAGAIGVALIALLAAPTAWAATTFRAPVNGVFPGAGPSLVSGLGTGSGNGGFGFLRAFGPGGPPTGFGNDGPPTGFGNGGFVGGGGGGGGDLGGGDAASSKLSPTRRRTTPARGGR